MMNKVSVYIKRVLYDLYYAYYVIIEGVFRVSLSRPPILSITFVMSILVSFSLIKLIDITYLYWAKCAIPKTEGQILGLLIWLVLYWLTYRYYSPMQISIARRFRKDSIYRKVLFGIMAIVASGIIVYIHSILRDIRLEIYREVVKSAVG